MIRKFHQAKLEGQNAVVVWGTDNPRREFLHVDDLASACVFLIKRYEDEIHINVGTGDLLDVSRMYKFGWGHTYDLRDGIEHTYDCSSNMKPRRG